MNRLGLTFVFFHSASSDFFSDLQYTSNKIKTNNGN